LKYKTAIAGAGGMVGSALAKVLDNPILYDPPKKIGNVYQLNEADIVFICVPTPYNNGCDISIVEQTVSELTGNKIVVIKSTVIPGTTDKLQEQYPQHKFLFNPEFLTEATADQDMRYPDRQIIGYTKQSYSIAGEIMMLLPLAPFEKIIPAKEAEMVKYYGNTWFSLKVIFANQMYDLCEKMGIDYELVKESVAFDKRIGRTHLEIWHKGYRGFGNSETSKCIPKDLASLIYFAQKNGVKMELLEKVRELNNELLKMQGMRECPK
jgi:UDPglucose 6-dehydrogenase